MSVICLPRKGVLSIEIWISSVFILKIFVALAVAKKAVNTLRPFPASRIHCRLKLDKSTLHTAAKLITVLVLAVTNPTIYTLSTLSNLRYWPLLR